MEGEWIKTGNDLIKFITDHNLENAAVIVGVQGYTNADDDIPQTFAESRVYWDKPVLLLCDCCAYFLEEIRKEEDYA